VFHTNPRPEAATAIQIPPIRLTYEEWDEIQLIAAKCRDLDGVSEIESYRLAYQEFLFGTTERRVRH
jgi:hypothetical protein